MVTAVPPISKDIAAFPPDIAPCKAVIIFTILPPSGTATNVDMVIGAGQEAVFQVDNGSFVNAIRNSADGRMSISCVRVGNPVGE